MNASHIIATSHDHEGRAYAVPADWAARVTAAGDDPADWTPFEYGATVHTDAATGQDPTFTGVAVRIEWDEDETRETFEAACSAAGFTVGDRLDGTTYAADALRARGTVLTNDTRSAKGGRWAW